MGLAQYAGQPNVMTRRAYYTGTAALATGQLLFIDKAADESDLPPLSYKADDTISAAPAVTDDVKNWAGNKVAQVVAGNKLLYAGVVPDSEAGKVGPCYVELLVPAPGEVVLALVDGTTDVAIGDVLKADETKKALIKDAAPAAGVSVFRSLQSRTADTAKPILCLKI